MAVEHRAELGPHHAVDQEVDGGVEHKKDMRDKSQGDAPDREAPKVSFLTPVDILINCYLMHVQNKSRKVANEEDDNNEHENNGEAVITPSSSFPSPPDGQVYLSVQEGDGAKGKQSKNKKSCPIDVPGDIQIIHPQLSNIQVELRYIPILVVDHFTLKELWNVE